MNGPLSNILDEKNHGEHGEMKGIFSPCAPWFDYDVYALQP
jgi:hypothetical protein